MLIPLEWQPVAAVGLPLAAALAIQLSPRRWAEAWTYAAALATALCSAMMLAEIRAGGAVEARLFSIVPGLDLTFRADALGLTFGLLASGLWILASVYSSGYVRANALKNRRRYFACFAASIGSALGVAYAGNLLTFLLFYELLTLATYPLVVHKETAQAFSAGRRYLVYALSGGLALTVATIWTWRLTGTLDFVPGGFLKGHVTPGELSALFVLFLLGCGVKAAVMPLHAWLPAAMVAPSPVSALLHAVAVVKAGVFGCIRVLGFVFGPETLGGQIAPLVLLGLCAFTIVAGSLLALRQDNLKRRLAYSTIVHLSYIVLGAALLSPHGMTGSVFHLVNHGLAKITLFFCAGAIYAVAHLDRVSEFGGLGRRMPWTFAAFTIAALGLIGIPGLCGFVGKLFLCRGSVEAEAWTCLAVLLGASVLSASYLMPILWIAYFGSTPAGHAAAQGLAPKVTGEARPALLAPLVATACLVVVFGAVPYVLDVQHDLAGRVATAVFGGAP